MSQQSVLDQYNASLKRAGLPYTATVSADNKIVFANGPYAGQEIGLPNFNNTRGGGQDVRTITGPDAQHLKGTAIAGPDQGQSADMSQMPWWKEALIGSAFAAAPFLAPLAAGGALGPSAFGGSAAAGADASLPAVDTLGSAGTADIAGTATGAGSIGAGGAATGGSVAGATTAGGFNWGKFLPQAFSTGLQSFLGARAADSAANQQKQAGQAAAQSFSPFAQGGLDAYNQALGMFHIAPVSAAPGSIAVRPSAPVMSAPQPYSLASFNPPVPQPQPGQPMPAQPYSLSTFSTGGR